ncbi:MAG: response regulator transcription factor [Actinobacteria bacterium]|nr:response regulator transcription factor [Actinomycetota bacterium]
MTEHPARVVLVEDDEGIARPLAGALRNAGYDVEHVTTGRAALQAVGPLTDAVVLDLGLPDIDGVEVCRRLRRSYGEELPILVLTARASETDVVVGLDAGADDYVTKPFRLAELEARLRALLRRTRATAGAPEALVAQDVRVEPGPRRAYRGDEELELTPKEFDLLQVLLEHAGRVVSRDELMRRVWDEHWFGSTKTLDVHVSSLRRKLGDDPATPRYVTTVRGVGLRFEVEAP